MIAALTKYKPNIADDMVKIILSGDVENIFPKCERIPIDYAVIELAASEGLVYFHPADFGWSDLGNWHSLHEKLKKDENNNATMGVVNFFESQNNLVHMESAKRVVILGGMATLFPRTMVNSLYVKEVKNSV